MKRIDFHLHLFPDALAPRAMEKLTGITRSSCAVHPRLSQYPELYRDIPYTDGTMDGTLRFLDEQQVDAAVMLSIATNARQQHNVNSFAAQVQRACPGRLYAFGSVYPTADDALQELERVKSLGLPGIKLHPEYQEFFLDDPKVQPIFEACEALGLMVTLHMGYDVYSPHLMHATPKMAAAVHRRFPGLTLILAHMGGIFCWDEAERYVCGEDVYLDTGYTFGVMDPQQLLRMIKAHGASRILFGSDAPWQSPANAVRLLESLDPGLSDEEKALIYYKNAQRLLKTGC